ncbi:NACHT domain-containing protein [Methanofollis aquaemaris]|uniref:NACHT domain-containing protein n=1 Tax=Methanofollis aquaemaris TaxID=126734 RepID=A0A8A3S6N5_9EURY|nr:NACHT domain-containing protein [Methanofollis aquaemaris]QSZ67391.1 NACHT domain-containing protein [Methanofollis aquaemaris]
MVIAEAIIGVISNATFQLFGEVSRKFRRDLQTDRELSDIVSSAVEKIETNNGHDVRQIEVFLRSQEVETVVRQIFSAKVLKKDHDANIDMIRREFGKLLLLHLDLTEDNIVKISDSLFDALIAGCANVYVEDIRRGSLFAHEMMENLRFRMLQDELENLNYNIRKLESNDKPTVQQYLEFERKYRRQVTERYKYLSTAHFKNAEKILLDDLYVFPNFLDSMSPDVENRKLIACEDFVSLIYRSVVLGDPGAGKTTLTYKLCYDFGRGFTSKQLGGRDVTPILVVLRDYGTKFESNHCSILEYIEEISRSLYQQKPPAGAFEYLLMNGRAFVIFDGLDELLDTSKRRTISDNIESFCDLYPSVPILVTSRKVGYEQAPLSKDRFKKYYISDFNNKQVKEYVEKWFKHNLNSDDKEIVENVVSFLNESISVKDLRSNPLMLSLMCELYRGEGYIPKNRPDVYGKCSELLFERWDKIRGIDSDVSFEAHLRPTLMYIANEVYSNEKLQTGVPERTFIELTENYLYPKRYDDPDMALLTAKKFVKFCKGRAWVFSEVGSPGISDNLYQFTHRTFLEYFTAYFLVRNYKSPEDLGNFLLPKISNGEWDLVAQLSLQIQNRNQEDAANELLSLILDASEGMNLQSRFNLLSFVVRSLEFIAPSPDVTKNIVFSCMALCIDLNLDAKQNGSYFNESMPINELIYPLVTADTVNIIPIRKSLIEYISNGINCSENDRASSALSVFSVLPYFSFYYEIKEKKIVSDHLGLDKLIFEVFQENKRQIYSLCKNNRFNALDGVYYQIIPLDDIIETYGPGVLFSVNIIHGTSPVLTSSIIDCVFSNLTDLICNTHDPSIVLSRISYLCQQMQLIPVPWSTNTIPIQNSPFSEHFQHMMDAFQKYVINYTADDLFNLFLIIAPMVEYEQYICSYKFKSVNASYYDKSQIFDKIRSIDNTILDPILFIFRAKLRGFCIDEVEDLIREINFTQKQRDLILQWIEGQQSFLAIKSPLISDETKFNAGYINYTSKNILYSNSDFH